VWSGLFLGMVGVLGAAFLHIIGIAALNETYSFQFFADSVNRPGFRGGPLG